jgi:Ni/Co efflux regulator RcnB
MKRLILAAIAASMLAAPAAQADTRGFPANPPHVGSHKAPPHAPQKKLDRKGPDAPHWSRGKRVPDWRKKQAVRDYHRHGLRKPGRGQQWVRIGNDYLLISIASGIVASIIIAGR